MRLQLDLTTKGLVFGFVVWTSLTTMTLPIRCRKGWGSRHWVQPGDSGAFPVRAKVSCDIAWDGALATEEIENHAQQFKGFPQH